MNINAIKEFLVRSEDGSIDYTSSRYKLEDALLEYEKSHDGIAKAINVVFDRFRGVKINKPGIATFVMGDLKVTPDNMNDVRDSVLEFLDANTGTRESGCLFGTIKGKGGGSFRWSDQAEETATAK